jgi:hypothetical protein
MAHHKAADFANGVRSFAGRTNRRTIIQRGKHGPTSSEKAVHLTTGDDLKPSDIKPIV